MDATQARVMVHLDGLEYHERVTSARTQLVFVTLSILFLLLSIWRGLAAGPDLAAGVLFSLFMFFLFYSLNFRILDIRLTSKSIRLRFGLFTWTVAMDNIDEVRLDEISGLLKFGGAGIHFMFVDGRSRASFNFLEHLRVLISLKNKAGPVRELSFSTRRPQEVLQRLHQTMLRQRTAQGEAALPGASRSQNHHQGRPPLG
jgi:hypothetical protein